jgi:hypothetical protein
MSSVVYKLSTLHLRVEIIRTGVLCSQNIEQRRHRHQTQQCNVMWYRNGNDPVRQQEPLAH